MEGRYPSGPPHLLTVVTGRASMLCAVHGGYRQRCRPTCRVRQTFDTGAMMQEPYDDRD